MVKLFLAFATAVAAFVALCTPCQAQSAYSPFSNTTIWNSPCESCDLLTTKATTECLRNPDCSCQAGEFTDAMQTCLQCAVDVNEGHMEHANRIIQEHHDICQVLGAKSPVTPIISASEKFTLNPNIKRSSRDPDSTHNDRGEEGDSAQFNVGTMSVLAGLAFVGAALECTTKLNPGSVTNDHDQERHLHQ